MGRTASDKVKLKDPYNQVINPATEETLEKLLENSNYRHKLTDDSSSPEYYMFLSNDYNYDLDTGDWKILKMTDEETFYCFGSDNYETNWTNRASLTYN